MRPRPRRGILIAACALAGLSACGGATTADDSTPSATVPDQAATAPPTEPPTEPSTEPSTSTDADEAAATAPESSTESGESTTSDEAVGPDETNAPEQTDAPDGATAVDITAAPAEEDGSPVATGGSAVGVESTPELMAFEETHGDLVEEWSTQLTAFGDEAIDHIDDVSTAPAAPAAADLSDQLIAAIGDEPTDDNLITLRIFAQGVSTAIGYAADGDQESALSVFLGLQAQSDSLTTILDYFEA